MVVGRLWWTKAEVLCLQLSPPAPPPCQETHMGLGIQIFIKIGISWGVFWGRCMPPIITTTLLRNTHGNGNPKHQDQNHHQNIITTTTIKNPAGDRDQIFIKIWNFQGVFWDRSMDSNMFFPEDLGPDFWRHWKGTTEKFWYRQWYNCVVMFFKFISHWYYRRRKVHKGNISWPLIVE